MIITKAKKNKAEATLGENLRSYHIPAKLARLLNDRYLDKILSKYNIDPSTKSLDEKRSMVISEQNRLAATGLLKGWKSFKMLYFTEGRKDRLCEAFIPEARDLIMKTPMCPTSERKARPRLDRFEDPNFVEPASSVESSKSSSRIPQSVTPKASQKSAAERSEEEQEQEHEEELEAEVEEGEPEVQTKDRYPSVIKTAPAAADAAATVSKAKERPAVPAAAKTATAGANTAAKTAPAVAAAAAATVSKAKERPAVPAAATATAGANTAATAVPAAATPAFVIKQKDVKAKQPAKPAGPAKPASDLAPAASSAGTRKPSKPAAAYPTSPLDAEFSQQTPQVKVTKAAVVINNNTGSNKGTTRNVKAGNTKIPATTTKTEPTPVNIMRGQGGPPKSAHSGLVHPEADSGDDQKEPNVDSLVEDVPTNHGDPDDEEEVEQQLDGRDDGDGEDSDGDLRMDDGDADDFLLHERNLSDSDSDYEVDADDTVERDGDAVLPDAHDVFDESSSEEDGGLPGSESSLPAHLRYQSMEQDQDQFEPSTPFETYLSDRLDTLESFIMQLGVKSDNIFVKLSKRTYAKSIKNNNFGDKNNNKKKNKINACLENFTSARAGDDSKVVKGRGNKKMKAVPKSKEKEQEQEQEKEKQNELPTSARKDAKRAHLH